MSAVPLLTLQRLMAVPPSKLVKHIGYTQVTRRLEQFLATQVQERATACAREFAEAQAVRARE